ncbi:MAG: adenosine deaminase [Gemmatimonadetes bacterium]|nr:adenosine deaminase [Gemmatimonadota bacterium]
MRTYRIRQLITLALLALLPAGADAQDLAPEERTARYMEMARGQTPLLVAFLREMPKGADLHSHLSGAVYAESFLRWAAEDGGCVSRRELRIINAPCTVTPDTVRAASLMADATLYAALVDAFSMRNWNDARISGHDQFFGTFRRFDAQPRRTGDMLAEASSRAAAGRVSYMELMQTMDGRAARTLGQSIGWQGDFALMRDTLLASGIQRIADAARARIDSIQARRDTVLRCDMGTPDPGCGVTVRWLYQVSRANPPEQVFAQILLGFLLAQADPRVVGFNLVQPEDNPLAMAEYSRQMAMIGFLRPLYPQVRFSLHAGELAAGLVPPEGLRFHVREAVEIAGASRIGHGVAVMYEDRPHELLAEMARRGVMVEINLTSNDAILGVSGSDHPLRVYLGAGVPVALSTDDEGVARSDITMEYLRAVRDQGLGYPVLKKMARTSLAHAFISGEPLWMDLSALTPVPDCAPAAGGLDGARCVAFTRRSQKAALQRELERGFRIFEARWK